MGYSKAWIGVGVLAAALVGKGLHTYVKKRELKKSKSAGTQTEVVTAATSELPNEQRQADVQLEHTQHAAEVEYLRTVNRRLQAQIDADTEDFATLNLKLATAVIKLNRFEECWEEIESTCDSMRLELVESSIWTTQSAEDGFATWSQSRGLQDKICLLHSYIGAVISALT